jgi:hypothetical protein
MRQALVRAVRSRDVAVVTALPQGKMVHALRPYQPRPFEKSGRDDARKLRGRRSMSGDMRRGAMMRLQVVRAIYYDGTLVFAHPEVVPRNGTEVVVTYLDDSGVEGRRGVDPLQALRGRGKGESLVARLLQARREDRERDASGRKPLCT